MWNMIFNFVGISEIKQTCYIFNRWDLEKVVMVPPNFIDNVDINV